VADPPRDLPFNLALTPDQLAARSQVPLPYRHPGKLMTTVFWVKFHDRLLVALGSRNIVYDPDSADDFDDEDPDEDLDL
jgi:elongator complex protein 5